MWHNLTQFQKEMLAVLQCPEPPIPVWVESGTDGIELHRTQDGWHLRLEAPFMLGRATMLLEEDINKPVGWVHREKPSYSRLGVLVDCSRNAVPTPAMLKQLLGQLCRMGYNTVQLYMEDVYEVEGYPYFGHGRGRYTREELRELDNYASCLGIELIPAIQTLAHLGQTLKWKAMDRFVDTGDILLADSPHTEALLNAMFDTLRACFSTNRVNIGMDEAHMLGLGKHLEQHGYENRTALMLRHFSLVHTIANAHDFHPMLWSDMFFRLASGGEYYVPDCEMDISIAKAIPPDTKLIYWDYYSQDEQFYSKMLARHQQLCAGTVFAGGAWKWSGFAPANRFSMQLAELAHSACVKQGVDEVFITLWGDNGAECPLQAVFPTLQYWAELCWQGTNGAAQAAARRFTLTCGGHWEDFLLFDELAFTPDNPSPGRMAVNATKTLLYEDILTPLFSPALDLAEYETHLQKCVSKLARAQKQAGAWCGLFQFYLDLADTLACKAHVQRVLHTAWERKERETLSSICQKDLPALHAKVNAFADAFRRSWLTNNKAPGLDIFDLRIGGQLERINAARRRLESWLGGQTDHIEELDIPWLAFDPEQTARGHADVPAPFWHRIISPTDISSI